MFKTSLPNPAIWNGPTQGLLTSPDRILQGGWWHDSRILAATGEGLEKEEKRAWKGWWNEKVVKLVELSSRQPDALTVLLTGRSEQRFSELIKRIIKSKDLEFDMVGLKPKVSPSNETFRSTLHFKQIFLSSLMETYSQAKEIKIYEDRPKHTQAFQEFLDDYNNHKENEGGRNPLKANVIQVNDTTTNMDPVVEVAEIQKMLNVHNDLVSKDPITGKQQLQIKKTVFFTSYMIRPDDVEKIKKLVDIPNNISFSELKFLGSNILICARPCPPNILEKIGGIGARMMWKVVSTGVHNDSIWAVRVRPVQANAVYHTDSNAPMVVVAHRKGSRPADANRISKWTSLPPGESIIFETVIGEKVTLHIEGDGAGEGNAENFPTNRGFKRKFDHDNQSRGVPPTGPRGLHTNAAPRGPGRGGRGGFTPRNNRNFSKGSGRGRGRGGSHYRSLDDMGTSGQQGGGGRSGGGGQFNGTDLQNFY